jgi:hypothetical protein
MILLWLVAGVSLGTALVALTKARRTAKRLEQLAEMYWELKYRHGELRVRVQHMTGGTSPDPAPPVPGPPPEAFVPLTSLAPHRAGVRSGDPAQKR